MKNNANLNKIPLKEKKSILQIIESDVGGGAEKLVSYMQEGLTNSIKVITFKILNKKFENNTKYRSLNIKNKSLWAVFIASFKICRLILKQKNKPTLVFHSHLSKALYSTFIPSIIFRIPHIHTEHNTFNKRRKKWFLYFIEYLIYNSLKSIICVSEATRYELLSYMPSLDLNKVIVIENGVELIQHKSRIFFNKKKFNIIILGSLTYKKGIDLFLSSIPSLEEKINKVKIIGSGPEKEKLQNLINIFSLNSLVELIDYTEDIKTHLYEADIGVIPSRWEGFGLVAVEMRSSGLPILISDVSGLSDIFSHYNGVVTFKAESKNSLKSSFNNLLEDLSSEKIVVKNLESEFSRYSLKFFLNKYDKFYDRFKL